jgi:predicted GNAT family N-acyltransferase
MRKCSVTKKLQIVRGSLDDYGKLERYHYRSNRLTAYAALFAMRLANETVGVIVYTMPSPGLELRNVAVGNIFTGLDRQTQLALINRNIRCIGRVIIEPRFRGLGLASRLVRQTMPQMNVPIVEALAVMGLVNPFFEKAGMTAYRAPMPARCVQLIEAFSIVGVEKNMLIDPQKVQRKIDRLKQDKAEFIELQIKHFLQSYGKRRNMSAGQERTEFVLSKLTERPLYYIWFNRNLELRI